MATELVPEVMKAAEITKFSTVGSFKGADLEYVETNHPFMPRKSPLRQIKLSTTAKISLKC